LLTSPASAQGRRCTVSSCHSTDLQEIVRFPEPVQSVPVEAYPSGADCCVWVLRAFCSKSAFHLESRIVRIWLQVIFECLLLFVSSSLWQETPRSLTKHDCASRLRCMSGTSLEVWGVRLKYCPCHKIRPGAPGRPYSRAMVASRVPGCSVTRLLWHVQIRKGRAIKAQEPFRATTVFFFNTGF